MKKIMNGQFTYEGCLAWCLQWLASEKPSLERELEILNYSLRFTKKDFTIGHLEAVHDNFKTIELEMDADFRYEFNSVVQLKKSKNIMVNVGNVLELFKFYLEAAKARLPMIIYLDAFALWRYRHYPHYVIVLRKQEKKFQIVDPWDGKKRIVPEEMIYNGIVALKAMGFAPRIIRIESLIM